MGEKSAIEWTDATWNPTVGCDIISSGCTHCYAMRMAARLERMGQERYAGLTAPTKTGPVWTGAFREAPRATLVQPLSWSRPRRVFVNSMSDLFHVKASWPLIDKVFAVMALAPRHTFQILTKRSWLMRSYVNDAETPGRIVEAACALFASRHPETLRADGSGSGMPWPLPNVWLGISVESQFNEGRFFDLSKTVAAKRFVSLEPLIGPIDLSHFENRLAWLNWVIVGGESGPGARPMHPDWARGLRDQCLGAGVPFFFKQWGENDALGNRVGKRLAGAELDGREWKEMPT